MGERKSIRAIQQELAENSGFGSEIIWDQLHSNDAKIMRNKIEQLIPDQEKGQDAIEDLRYTIFKNVWKQRKYTNGNSLSYIFYVMVTKRKDFNTAADSTEFSCHPVFRCKKCEKSSDTRGCCMIYIDETGRVYQNWKSYLNENVLPAGRMVTPRNGIYNFNESNEVILDTYCTPNGTEHSKSMQTAETYSAIAGVGAAMVPIAALIAPISAPVMAAAGAVGLFVGAFNALTSVANLIDRKSHGQSIHVNNRQARASYIGVVGGGLGVAAAGTTRLMTSMAAAGKATTRMEMLVNGINITSIVISGSGVATGVLDLFLKYKDGENISNLDILQLSASLILFTHSLHNFQLASQIADNARVNTIKSYRETLSNRQRKMFDKISKETVRIRGSTKGKMDIIRGVNEIPDRQYLNDLFKVNKRLNQHKVRPAFGESGKNIVLNNEVPVSTAKLRDSIQYNQGPNILEQVTSPIPTTHNSDIYTTKTTNSTALLLPKKKSGQDTDINNYYPVKPLFKDFELFLPNGDLISLRNYGAKFLNNIADGDKFQNIVLSMGENLEDNVIKFILKLCQDFIDNFSDEIHEALKMFIPTECVLYYILKHILDHYRFRSLNYVSDKSLEIKGAVKKHFLSQNSNNSAKDLKRCPDCGGTFNICKL